MQYSEGPRAVVISEDVKQKGALYCRLTSADLDQLEECVGGFPFRLSIDWSFVFLTKYFVPSWEYAVYQ